MDDSAVLNGPAAGKNRRAILAAGFVLLLFLGLIYAWSVFVVPLENEFGWNRQETSLAFTVSMCAFCAGGFIAGMAVRAVRTRWILIAAAVLVSAGFALASRIQNLAGFYVCYGVFAGLGTGFGYNAVISSIAGWFPEKPGLVPGLLLTGFGLGGMVLGTAGTFLTGIYGWRSTFQGIAAVSLVLVSACSFIIAPPPEKEKAALPGPGGGRKGAGASRDFTAKEMLRDPSFWLVFLWAVCLSSGGLALIGHASPFALDLGASVSAAAFYAGLVSVFNGVGRAVSGFFFDRLGRRLTMIAVSAGFVISPAILLAALGTGNILFFAAGCAATGLFYGGIMTCNSAAIGTLYGQKYYPLNLSIITMNILAASPLGPFMSGVLRRASGSYSGPLCVMGALGLLAVFLALIIRPERRVPDAPDRTGPRSRESHGAGRGSLRRTVFHQRKIRE